MPEDEFDPWRTLGVPVGSRPPEIRRAFRKLARRMHPDVSRDRQRAHEQFIRLRQAYETLMDEEMRAALERRILQAETEPLIIIDDFEVSLDDAWELLARGYVEEARLSYLELARQRPGDPRLLELLETIHRIEDHGASAAMDASPRSASRRERRGAESAEGYRDLWEPEPIAIRWWAVGAAVAVVIGSTWAVGALDAPTVIGPYSLAEIAIAAAAGFFSAALVAGSGLLGSFDLELGETARAGAQEVPVWLYLGVAGVLSPVIALLFYLIFVLLLTEWSWRVAGFFAGTFVLAAVLGLAHGANLSLTVLAGSSAIFVPGLLGWAIGSIFKPGHWWQ